MLVNGPFKGAVCFPTFRFSHLSDKPNGNSIFYAALRH